MANRKYTCKECLNDFISINRYRRVPQFCCCSCANAFSAKKRFEQKPNNTVCSFCDREFYRPDGNKHSKSGLYFCNKKCKDLGQRISAGIIEIHPNHYRNGESTYSKRAKEQLLLKCSRCEYDKIPEVLEVHHKDRNRKNNNLSNLEILCPTCHEEEHFLRKDGKYKKNKKSNLV